MTRKKEHEERFKKPTAEALNQLPKDVLADMLADAYTDALCTYAGICTEHLRNNVEDAVEKVKVRAKERDTETEDLFDQS